MHVACIITSFTAGGAEMLVGNLAEAFVANGHGATVIALSDAATLGNDEAIERAMMVRLREVGVTAKSLGLRNRRDPFAGARALRSALADRAPDMIHTHTAAAIPAIALARMRCPVVLTHHNSRLSFPPFAYRLFDRIVAAYVAISDQCAQQTQRHARKPIRPIPNAANPRFRASAPRTAPAQDPVILGVGTISEQKDYATLIRAARPLAERLAATGRRPCIRIAGGGDAIDELRALAAEQGVEDIVDLLGARSDVQALMAEADVFANSSLWEGFSIAMIEASMSALPLVATDVAGNCEMVLPGRNGMLVPPRDPDALADALARVVTDPALYAALSAGSLASASRFSIDRCTAAHLALYRDVIAQARLRPAIGRSVLG